MYSKNDYRYYLENHLIHSNDFFAHYGVKGMKWKHHKSTARDLVDDALARQAQKEGRVYPEVGGALGSDGKTHLYKLNNKDRAYFYADSKGWDTKERGKKATKKIKNKKLRKVANKAIDSAYNAYEKNVTSKFEKRAFDSHNIYWDDNKGKVIKRGKKLK